ncbi:soluble NSF attachment protein, SNAP domain-containing protein [Trichoderma breve]|uniref:Gamma-soluble NSF attachment protein n=1 Tax=Trichoderma breve TaxID=2034170 RepID=A0A9W9BFX2_9HYPO|nr:soluble NSF attachment protein, SNAP domain-containing protein [Trichoderma breve]KAJ4859153.1 soluble NSF attachment protein, SNAP domain-containing protein [Trichoderma breve]
MNNPEALIQQAEKLVAKGKSGWSFFGGSEERYEQAATCYRQAAEAYELRSNFLDAAATYVKAAEIQEKNLSDGFEAPDSYVHASDAYRRAVMEEAKPINENEKAEAKAKAINCRKKAIKLTESSSSGSKLRRLSRMYDAIGQINEKDIAGPLVQARRNLLSSKTLTAADEERMKNLAMELQPTPNEADELQWLQSKTAFSDEEKAHLKWLESQILPALDEARIAYKEAANFLRLDAPLSASKLFEQYADLSVFIATLLPHSTEKNANSTQKDKNSYYEDALNAYATILKALQGDPKKNRFSIPTYCFKWCVCRLAQCDHVATTRDIPTYQGIEMDTYRQSEMHPDTLKSYIQSMQSKYTLLFDLNEAIKQKDREMIDEILQANVVDDWQKNVFTDIQNKYEPKDDEFA